jgi:hypothetical protein
LLLKVPLLVAGLMVLVGLIASQLVLSRLERTQQAHLRALTAAYLDGTAAASASAALRKATPARAMPMSAVRAPMWTSS